MNMEDLQDFVNIIKTTEYMEARAIVTNWKSELPFADQAKLVKIAKKRKSFFFKMKNLNPKLYQLFQSDDKELSEMIYEKLNGKKITFD